MKTNLTSFEWQVLKAAMTIPIGETRSYSWIAKKIGHPKAARAVGSALKKNPFPLIIPCHRVVQTSGKLGGYSCGGVKNKAMLLRTEQYIAQKLSPKRKR